MARLDTAAAGGAPTLDLSQWFIDAWRPTDWRGSYEIADIQGEVPREIHGTLYRNGPNQNILPAQGYKALHLFDGDGLINAFRFEDGKIHHTAAIAENPTYLREQELGRFCMNTAGVKAEDPDDQFFLRMQHNTNVVHHGGKLMALVENAWPFEMDARTLASKGMTNFGVPELGMSVTAHPKIDGRTGQMLIHGYGVIDPLLQLYVVEPDGKASLAEQVEAPYATMMHDFAITENYVIFVLTAVRIDGERLINGAGFTECVYHDRELPLKFGIRRREPGSPVQWFETANSSFIFHPGNAYEDGDRIVMDACTYFDPAALLASLATWRSGSVTPGFDAKPTSYEFNLTTGECRETVLDERGAEFPRCDDRLVGYRNRFGYAALNRGTSGTMDDVWSTIVKYDRQGGPNQAHDFGQWHWPSEPVFVPRAADADEDDGFVLNVVYDGTSDSSYLSILDARNMAGEPLAKCTLKERIPMGFHGNFAQGVV
jgi:carotenoid cleavage dioxygenase-like enzyme